MAPYYPLAVGNSWTYRTKDGKTFTNEVIAADGQKFTMKNSMTAHPQFVEKKGDTYLADNFESGNFQPLLKEPMQAGDRWEVRYKANNFDNILFVTVKQVDGTLEVEGKKYTGVALVEGELKMNMNGQLMPLNYTVQYHYAPGVGLVLTTSSHGDSMGLVSCVLK